MPELRVQILRFVDEHQPGVVECKFTDAEGRQHTLIDKLPVFTAKPLDASSPYPQLGAVRCEVKCRWQQDDGRSLVRVSIARPDGIESVDGISEFVVLDSQLAE